jgi:hypothetical protein
VTDALKKAIGGGALGVITDFVNEYTKLLHTPSFVHPDWDATIDADARVWCAGAVIVLYVILMLTKANKYWLAGVTIASVLACGVMLWICSSYAQAVPAYQAAVADRMIDAWRRFFLWADVFAVCAGAALGMFVADLT